MITTKMMLTMTTYKDARLKEAVECYGNNWVMVAADVGGEATRDK